nr:hypothetical protein [Tanacetum cinerariifolium]
MCRATLPISFWGYALETASHILNLVPTKKVSKTPFEMWKGERPSLGHIKIWGCEEESFGYLFYKPRDNVVFLARRRVFLKREMISKEDNGSKIDLKEIQESVDEESIVNTDTQQEVVTLVEPDDISLHIHRTSNKEAMASLKAAKWKEAMKSEIQSMYDNRVWNLVDTTPALKTVGCKWIFKKNIDMDGKVHNYKAWLVAKGYTQTHRIDYEETFSPRMCLWHNQKDLKMQSILKRVCKLQKAIYGLKQASYCWNICFHEKVTQFGFSRSEDESCIYVKVSESFVVFLVLYVDEDILLIGNDILMLQSVKDWLGKCFAMKDLGDAAYILGIKIYRDMSKRLIGLSQDTYLDKILKRFKMENSKKGNLPLHHAIKISKDLCLKIDEELDIMSRVLYSSAIGLIMYAMMCTRPDVSFALSMSFTVWLGILAEWGSAVAWKSSKQDTVADFTCEFEYIAAFALDVTLYLVDHDRLRPIIVADLSMWETVGFSVQVHN